MIKTNDYEDIEIVKLIDDSIVLKGILLKNNIEDAIKTRKILIKLPNKISLIQS